MNKIVSTFLVLSFAAIFGVMSSFAQTGGTHVDANIPFDFSIDGKTFKAGSYDLSIAPAAMGTSLYSVSLKENGQEVYRTTATRNADVSVDKSEMLFTVIDGTRFLDKIITPEIGFSMQAHTEKVVAAENQGGTQSTGSSPN